MSNNQHFPKALVFVVGLFLLAKLALGSAVAETLDFGGYAERFKGKGDRIPPHCQIDMPDAASSSFFISWYCTDDNASEDDIKTELWIFRKNEPASVLLRTFLGFPAAVKIDEGILQSADFKAGLPASFRLVAWDRAGTTTISPLLTVLPQDSKLQTCTLEVKTSSTEATETTTGTPASTVTLKNVSILAKNTSNGNYTLSMSSAQKASPCELDSICEEEQMVKFVASVSLQDESVAKGNVTITPGSVSSSLEGSYKGEADALESLNLSGEATIDQKAASVSLVCSK